MMFLETGAVIETKIDPATATGKADPNPDRGGAIKFRVAQTHAVLVDWVMTNSF